MVQSQFSLSWDSYKSNICSSFSVLQQNGEFVDMTLAADGHFVQVHQVLMAMVSPYLKELITSAPCKHPVIFLNNVSYRTLSCLLEYVYTGEVLVPSENLMSFIETAKSLHIKGLEDFDGKDKESEYKMVDNLSQMDSNIPCHMSGLKRLGVPTDGSGKVEISLPAAARKVLFKYQKPSDGPKHASNTTMESQQDVTFEQDVMDTSEVMNQSDDDIGNTTSDKQLAIDPQTSSNLQFSMSIRGSLQVILNRYIYNFHTVKQRTGVRRWRCVDYRNHRCKAFLVTKGNIVLNRANLHNHSFHDRKILQKIEKKAVFSALADVELYKAKEYKDEGNGESPNEHEAEGVTVEFTHDSLFLKKRTKTKNVCTDDVFELV